MPDASENVSYGDVWYVPRGGLLHGDQLITRIGLRIVGTPPATSDMLCEWYIVTRKGRAGTGAILRTNVWPRPFIPFEALLKLMVKLLANDAVAHAFPEQHLAFSGPALSSSLRSGTSILSTPSGRKRRNEIDALRGTRGVALPPEMRRKFTEGCSVVIDGVPNLMWTSLSWAVAPHLTLRQAVTLAVHVLRDERTAEEFPIHHIPWLATDKELQAARAAALDGATALDPIQLMNDLRHGIVHRAGRFEFCIGGEDETGIFAGEAPIALSGKSWSEIVEIIRFFAYDLDVQLALENSLKDGGELLALLKKRSSELSPKATRMNGGPSDEGRRAVAGALPRGSVRLLTTATEDIFVIGNDDGIHLCGREGAPLPSLEPEDFIRLALCVLADEQTRKEAPRWYRGDLIAVDGVLPPPAAAEPAVEAAVNSSPIITEAAAPSIEPEPPPASPSSVTFSLLSLPSALTAPLADLSKLVPGVDTANPVDRDRKLPKSFDDVIADAEIALKQLGLHW